MVLKNCHEPPNGNDEDHNGTVKVEEVFNNHHLPVSSEGDVLTSLDFLQTNKQKLTNKNEQ